MSFFLLLIFALMPSFIWLWFFLQRDRDPEPRWMLIKVFLLGALMVVPAIGFQSVLAFIPLIFIISLILSALIEEVVKYWASRTVLRSPEFDEPVDAMIYMITAGLGFAAAENLLLLIGPMVGTISDAIGISILRFLTATFIHALAPGLWGYFIARQRFQNKKCFWWGLIAATAVHAVYNLAIFGLSDRMDNQPYLIYALLLIVPLGIGILEVVVFTRLKKIKHQEND